MHTSLAKKIRKRIKNSRVTKVYYASERNEIRERVAMHFNAAIDSVGDENFDMADVDKRFYGSLPSGDQFLFKWDTDVDYRKKLLLEDAHTFFIFWKDRGEINNWMAMFEDDYVTIKKDWQELIFARFEEGISRAKSCIPKIVAPFYNNHDSEFAATHVNVSTLWIYYGYYCYQRYWMRTIEPSAKGMAI